MDLKKVLIITYYWPPSAGSGVQRWLKFAKYLPEFGWHPYIYTPENPDFELKDEGLLSDVPTDCTVIKKPIWEPYSLAKKFSGDKKINVGVVGDGPNKTSQVKKIMNWIRGNLFIPDPRVFWRRSSVNFLKSYIIKEEITHIVTTGPPHSMHLIGLGLKRKLDLKWIVDIRDPWSKLDFLDTFYVTKYSRKKYEKMEKEVLSECDIVLGTSPSMKHELLEFDHSKFNCITNGYDREDFPTQRNEVNEKEITIYHAGLLNKMRNPVKLWESINNLCEKDHELDKRLRIHLAGVIDPNVISSIKSFKHLENKLIVEEYKSHKEVLSDYRKSTILLLLINNTGNARVNIPGKLFEYIASKKNILCIGETTADAALIVNNNNLGMCYSYTDQVDVKGIINHKIQESIEISEDFTRKSLTEKLVKILESI